MSYWIHDNVLKENKYGYYTSTFYQSFCEAYSYFLETDMYQNQIEVTEEYVLKNLETLESLYSNFEALKNKKNSG